MGSMFSGGFDAKDIGVFVDYLKQIFQMIIELFKSLSNKADAAADDGDDAGAGEGAEG